MEPVIYEELTVFLWICPLPLQWNVTFYIEDAKQKPRRKNRHEHSYDDAHMSGDRDCQSENQILANKRKLLPSKTELF